VNRFAIWKQHDAEIPPFIRNLYPPLDPAVRLDALANRFLSSSAVCAPSRVSTSTPSRKSSVVGIWFFASVRMKRSRAAGQLCVMPFRVYLQSIRNRTTESTPSASLVIPHT
jgi:hypothetical protein